MRKNNPSAKVKTSGSKKVPHFKTVEEAAVFWDTHSTADYWDEMEDVDVKIELKDENEYIKIDQQLLQQIQMVAHAKKVSSRQLVTEWLREKLHQHMHT